MARSETDHSHGTLRCYKILSNNRIKVSKLTSITQHRTHTTNQSFFQKHGIKLIAALFWLTIVAVSWWTIQKNSLSPETIAENIVALLSGSLLGPLIYIGIYWLRPLIFFPSTILTALGGFLFGPIGILYTIIGGNGSAMVAYTVGRFFGEDTLDGQSDSTLMQKYATRMRENSFETILILRLILLPYDLVNYFSGLLKINWLPFLLATAIGSIPGTISVTLLGNSFGTLEQLMQGEFALSPFALIGSVLFIIISILLSRYFKQRETK